jgi:GDPmannose 4,6-dehydratase
MAGLLAGVELVDHDVRDTAGFRSLIDRYRPSTVFNLAALSSVSASWDDPAAARAINQTAVEEMVTVLAEAGTEAPRFVHASSSEIFGPPGAGPVLTNEVAPLDPQSPYAEAKAAAHLAVMQARADGVAAANIILFGHTSVLQTREFVLPIIARQAAEVGRGLREDVVLQNPAIRRDWGSATDVARAFVASLSAEPQDFIIATGVLHELAQIAAWALSAAGIDDAGVSASGGRERPRDFDGRIGDITSARQNLHWEPRTSLRQEIEDMVRVDLARLDSGVEHDPSYLA